MFGRIDARSRADLHLDSIAGVDLVSMPSALLLSKPTSSIGVTLIRTILLALRQPHVLHRMPLDLP